MKVLVTGAAGFLGRAVVDVLAAEHRLRLLEPLPFDTPHELAIADLADYPAVSEAVAGCEAVVNTVMSPYPCYEGQASTAFDANVKGLFHLLCACRAATITQVVHLSSCAVFTGLPSQEVYRDDLPTAAGSTYALTKLLQEEVCRYFCEQHGFAITMFRPWSIMDRETGVYKGGQPVSPDNWGNIDRYDLGRAVALALAKPGTGLRAYILAGCRAGREHLAWERVEEDLGWRPSDEMLA